MTSRKFEKINFLGILSLIFLPFSYAFGQKEKSTTTAFPMSITVAGGVSLGSYEAGYLYYSSEMFKHNTQAFDIKMLTGASAGSINAVLTLTSLCSPSWKKADESLFWKTWIPIGIDQLDVPDLAKSRYALFSKKEIDNAAKEIEATWNKGLSSACDIVLGIAATRASSNLQAIREDLAIRRVEERFLLRIKGHGQGVVPSVSNYLLPEATLPQTLLEISKTPSENFSNIRSLVLGSASVPLFFDPQPLYFCIREKGRAECDPKNMQKDYFVDGGIFDNSPLRLAYKTIKSGLKIGDDGKAVWQDKATQSRLKTPPRVFFSHLDIDAHAFPLLQEEDLQKEVEKNNIPLSHYFAQLSSAFIAHARSKEIYTLMEDAVEMKDHLRLTTNYFPRMSDHLNAFFGFFERDFREFDFILGMYDAQRYFRSYVSSRLERYSMGVKRPEHLDFFAAKKPDDFQKKLQCIVAYFDQVKDYQDVCKGVDENFLILAQVSMDRLFSYCRISSPNSNINDFYGHKLCIKSAKGENPPILFDKHGLVEWKQTPMESSVNHTTRLLAHYKFEYADLKLSRKRAWMGGEAIKHRISESIERLAAKQDLSENILINFVAKPSLNILGYTPPTSLWYFSLGGRTEIGNSYQALKSLNLSGWFRVNTAVQAQGILSKYYAPFGIIPLIGAEFEPVPLNDMAFQWRGALRFGYLLSKEDQYGANECPVAVENRYGIECSTSVGQVALSLGVFERVRLSATIEYPVSKDYNLGKFWNFFFGAGVQWY